MKLLNRFSRYKLTSWNVAIRKSEKLGILSDYNTKFQVIKNNINSWSADPFIYVKDNLVYIFAEIFDFELGRGVIGYSVYNPDDQKSSKWKKVIVEPYHMSFPYIYEEKGDVYIMPETCRGHVLSRYKAIDFPDVWERQDIEYGHKFADTALFCAKGVRYGYTLEHSIENHEEMFSRVFKFGENSIEMEDEIYSVDPLVMRLGGAFVENEGKLIKVSQDGTNFYGEAIVFSDFYRENGCWKEKVLKRIRVDDLDFYPNKKSIGIHTYNTCGDYEVIDLKREGYAPIHRMYILWNKVKTVFAG